MKLSYLKCLALLMICFLGYMPNTYAEDEIYIVYTNKNKGEKKKIEQALGDGQPIKTYNATLLLMADYSGKQKAIAKMTGAKLVIVIDQETMELLGNPQHEKFVVIENGSQENVDKITSML